VRRRQQLARWLLAQHERAIVEVDEERRIGLAAGDARQLHRTEYISQRAAQEFVQAHRIEAERCGSRLHQRLRGISR
jgi:hypothetical protein